MGLTNISFSFLHKYYVIAHKVLFANFRSKFWHRH